MTFREAEQMTEWRRHQAADDMANRPTGKTGKPFDRLRTGRQTG